MLKTFIRSCTKVINLFHIATGRVIRMVFVTNVGLLRSARSWRALGLGLAVALTLGPNYSSGQVSSSPCAPGSVTPPLNLVAWWSLNEGTGATAIFDGAGGDNNGTTMNGNNPAFINSGGPTQVTGQFVNNSLHFGTSVYARVPNSANLNFGTNTNFSIDAWINTQTSTQTEPILDKRGATNTGYSMSIQGNHLFFEIGAKSLQGPLITPGTWNFVGVTVKRSTGTGTAVTFYTGVPGGTLSVLSAPSFPPGANATNTRDLDIGLNPFNPHANISIDELEIFNRALLQNEITAIFKAGKKGKCWKYNPN
jgi:hypothetical protein